MTIHFPSLRAQALSKCLQAANMSSPAQALLSSTEPPHHVIEGLGPASSVGAGSKLVVAGLALLAGCFMVIGLGHLQEPPAAQAFATPASLAPSLSVRPALHPRLHPRRQFAEPGSATGPNAPDAPAPSTAAADPAGADASTPRAPATGVDGARAAVLLAVAGGVVGVWSALRLRCGAGRPPVSAVPAGQRPSMALSAETAEFLTPDPREAAPPKDGTRIAVLGDLHLDPREMDGFHECRAHVVKHLDAAATSHVVSLGDLGGKAEGAEPGSQKCFNLAKVRPGLCSPVVFLTHSGGSSRR